MVLGMSPPKKYALDWIDAHKDHLIAISDRIWEYAELGLVEFKSSSLLADDLEEHGFKIERGVADMPTAFVATWGEGKPTIGIMGEYDALPGLSQKKSPLKEPLGQGEPGHGCGHNVHGTSGLAAAIALKETMTDHGLQGTIKFFGCPAEENFTGKVFMVRAGCFRGVDAALSHHPNTMNGASLRSSLAFNSVRFHFYGKSSHSSVSPEMGRSALDAVELMNVGANYLREHMIQDARIHYVIEKGGNQPNVVPDYACSWYYVRAPERDQVGYIYDWVLNIAKGAALMSRTDLKIEPVAACYNIVPNRTISELVVNNMRKIGLPKYTDEELRFAEEIARSIDHQMKVDRLRNSKRPGWERLVDKLLDDEAPDPWGEGELSHGSTDVSDVSWQTPTVEFTTATWVLGTPGHSWQNTAQGGVGLGHKSMLFAAKVMVSTALDLLIGKEELTKAKREHGQRIGNRAYKTPIPPEIKPPLDFWERRTN